MKSVGESKRTSLPVRTEVLDNDGENSCLWWHADDMAHH